MLLLIFPWDTSSRGGYNGIGDGYENLRQYIDLISKAQEEERSRISRELHDSTIQSLIMILHHLERFFNANPELPMSTMRFLLNMQSQVQTVIKEVRYLSQNLRPSILEHLGLIPAIEFLSNGIRQNYKMDVLFTVEGEPVRYKPEVEVSLFRIIQETLNNITKHAAATSIEVMLDFRSPRCQMIIQDNGIGMEMVYQSFDQYVTQGKLGLIGISERVKLIGGQLEVISAKGKGTIIKITLPQ